MANRRSIGRSICYLRWLSPALNLPSYVNVLGFKLIPRPKFPFDGAWLVVRLYSLVNRSLKSNNSLVPNQLGNLMIHFFPPDPEFPSTNSTSSSSSSNDPRALRRGRHLAFQVENVEEAEKKLKAARIGYTRFGIPGSPAVQVTIGFYVCFVRKSAGCHWNDQVGCLAAERRQRQPALLSILQSPFYPPKFNLTPSFSSSSSSKTPKAVPSKSETIYRLHPAYSTRNFNPAPHFRIQKK